MELGDCLVNLSNTIGQFNENIELTRTQTSHLGFPLISRKVSGNFATTTLGAGSNNIP